MIRGSQLGREARNRGNLHHARRHDDVVGLERRRRRPSPRTCPRSSQRVHGCPGPDGELEMRRVRLEVVRHLVRRGVVRAPSLGSASREARRRSSPASRAGASPSASARDRRRARSRRGSRTTGRACCQVVSRREPRLTAADDHGVVRFGCHLGLLSFRSTVGRSPARHRTDPPISQASRRGHS